MGSEARRVPPTTEPQTAEGAVPPAGGTEAPRRCNARWRAYMIEMAAAHQEDRPLCHVCLEGDDEAEDGGGRLVHGGCGCRGSF